MRENMKVCFVAINAKYIHTSPAVRILNKIVSVKYDSKFFEFTIKDNINNIIEVIKDYDYIGLSCYIWNIQMCIKLSKEIKKLFPQKVVFAGGPEVSYDTKSFVDEFDYIISGEGEEIILPFIDSLIENSNNINELTLDVIPPTYSENYYFVSYSHKDYKKVLPFRRQ